MNLRVQAEADLAFTLEDDVSGYGWPMTLTDTQAIPVVHNVKGQYHRVGVDIDPQTGLLISGNKSAVTVRLSTLAGQLPAKGWKVATTDITGAAVTGEVPDKGVMLDRALGVATMVFKASA
jgi:hypothetical protein